ncbi:MAG: redoxin domain-containing protein, partial [Candidatus Promineifilaceae bacterium]
RRIYSVAQTTMTKKRLDPPIIHMPEFSAGQWLNSPQPLTRAQLRGQVLLIDFWDYTCINCLRTLPYLLEWHKRYADKGLVIVGVHAPEFKFGRDHSQIEAAIQEFNIRYPVLLDNDYQTWQQFATRAWPTKFLIDPKGYIRFKRQGEGYYEETERAIQELLQLRDATVSLPEILPPLRDEDTSGAVCYRPTPELHAGYQGGGLFGGALGNPEGYVVNSLMSYSMVPDEERTEGHFYLSGFWEAKPECVAFAGKNGGEVILPYRAVGVNVVLSPSSDSVELLLGLATADGAPTVEVLQDGKPLSPENAGKDILFSETGLSYVQIERPRLVQIVANPGYEWHELSLNFRTTGAALYAFTFDTCLVPRENSLNIETFRAN